LQSLECMVKSTIKSLDKRGKGIRKFLWKSLAQWRIPNDHARAVPVLGNVNEIMSIQYSKHFAVILT